MQTMKRVKKIIGGATMAVFVGATLMMGGCAVNDSTVQMPLEQYDDNIKTAERRGSLAGYNEAKADFDVTADNDIAIETFLATATEMDLPQALVDEIKEVADEVEAEDAAEAKYILDELGLGQSFTYELGDRRVSTLFDGEYELDGDKFDAKEVVNFNPTISINEKDYNAEPYMVLEKGDVAYALVFDNELNTSYISEDETLEFKFLGDDYESTFWDVDKVTFTRGADRYVLEGETFLFDEVVFTVDSIGLTSQDIGFASISIEGESRRIKVGDSETLGDYEITVTDTWDQDDNVDAVDLKIAKGDVLFEVEDGEEYNEVWDWAIDANSIGIVLAVDYNDLDDEDESPFAVGESFALPNDYLVFTFDGIDDDDNERFTLELDAQYDVEINADNDIFVSGMKDYDELYVDAFNSNISLVGFYDNDDVYIGLVLEIDNSDYSLELDGTYLTMGDVRVNLSLDTMDIYNGTEWLPINDRDEDYLTTWGFIVEDVEDSLDDNEFTIWVPEEELKAEISVYGE